MSRTRIISQNKAVYASPTGWYVDGSNDLIEPVHLNRVDTFSFDVDQAGSRQDIREFGQLARIGVEITSEINPSVSFGYFLGDGGNEEALGLTNSDLNAQFISGILTEDPTKREFNLYVATVKEGEDAFDATSFAAQEADHDVAAFGNVFLTSYSASFSVGEIPRVDVEAEASNVVFFTGGHSGFKNPSIDSQFGRADDGLFSLTAPDTGDMSFLVLRPQDVQISFENDTISSGSNIGTNLSDICIQSCTVDVPLGRENIECLGKERACAKPLETPINVTMNINGIVNNFKEGALEYVLTGTAGQDSTDIIVTVNDRLDAPVHKFKLQNAVLDSQNFSQGIDDNETVEMTFSAQIAGATNADAGLLWSGSSTAPTFPTSDGTAAANQPI